MLKKEVKEEILSSLGDVVKGENETKEEYVERIRVMMRDGAVLKEGRENKPNTKVIAIGIQKGGVGKSVLTSNLGYLLSQMGFKVLLIDADPQGSLTVLVNEWRDDMDDDYEIEGLSDLYAHVLSKKPMTASVIKSVIKRPVYQTFTSNRVTRNGKRMITREAHNTEFGFDFICGDITLADVEIAMAKPENVRYAGVAMLAITDVIENEMDYDFVLIDNAPGLGFLVYNSISAAHSGGLLSPLILEVMSITGLRNLIGTTAEIQYLLRERFKINHIGPLGIVVNDYLPRSRRQRNLEQTVDKFIPIKCFKTTIPSKEACDVAHLYGRLFSMESKEAYEAFELLAYEVIQREIEKSKETESRIITINDLGKEDEE